MIPTPAPVQPGASARQTGHEPHEPTVVGSHASTLETPKVSRGGRRASAGASPKNVTPLRSPNAGESASPIQGPRTPSTPFSAHVGMAIHTAPRITGLSGDSSVQGRGAARFEVANGDSPYLPHAITTSSAGVRGAQSPEARGRDGAPEASPQQDEFVSPSGKVPRPPQEPKRRTQMSQDSTTRHASAPVQTKREQRKSLPQPTGRLDPLWDMLAATIGAFPRVAPQTIDTMSRILKSGADRKSVRNSFDSVRREIMASRRASIPAPQGNASGADAQALLLTTSPLKPMSPPLQPDLLAWPPSPPLEDASPRQSPMASPELPPLPATPASRIAGTALSPDPRTRLSAEVLDFARHRFNTIKEGPFSRPPELEPLNAGSEGHGDGSSDSDSEGEAQRQVHQIRASFTVIPATDRNISAMSSPGPATPFITSNRQLAASSGNSSLSPAAAHPISPSLRIKASSPAQEHGRTKVQRHQSSGARSTVSPIRSRLVAFEPGLKSPLSPLSPMSPLSPKSPSAGAVHRASNSSVSPRFISPGAPRSTLASPDAGKSPAMRRSSSPEMAGFRHDRSVAMLAHWTGLMSALKLNSTFRTQAVAEALSTFCTILESGQSGQAELNAGFSLLLQAIKNTQPGFPASPQVTPSRKAREIGSPVRDARGDISGRFSGIQDGNVGLHLRKLAAEIESLAARPQLGNRADFRQAAQALIQWIKNQ